MKEILYHALGICGEHWHPNFINLSLISIFVVLLFGRLTKYYKKQ